MDIQRDVWYYLQFRGVVVSVNCSVEMSTDLGEARNETL